MKITQFKIKNYKSFGNSFNSINSVSDINFIYGENNSGKSNILKFLDLVFRNKSQGETDEITVEGKGSIKAPTSKSNNFFQGYIENEAYIYHKNERKKIIEFEFVIIIPKTEILESGYSFYKALEKEYFSSTHKDVTLKFSGKISSIDSMGSSEINLTKASINSKDIYTKDSKTNNENFFPGYKELENNKLAYTSLMGILNNSVEYIENDRYFTKEYRDDPESTLSSKKYKKWMQSTSLDEFQYDKFNELLQFIRDCKIKNFKVLEKLDLSFSHDKDGQLELMLNNGFERLPITSFGTGVSQILYLLTKLYFTNSKIILIEELELNLSYNMQREFFKVLREMIKSGIIDQVFFTSHSKAFNYRNDFSIYEMTMDAKGLSNVEYRTEGYRKSFFNNGLLN